jgi:hypothetical protein
MTCGSSSARLLVCASLVVCSCALQTATINQFVDPTYGPGTVNKLAVFPIRNQRLAPSEAQQVNRKISTAINQKNPSIQIMAAPEATQLLNDNGLAESWASFLDNYISSGVPDVKKLRSIGEALGVDAILQGEMVNVFQQDGRYGLNAGTTRVTVRFSLLGIKDGKLLWEASCDGLATTATTVEPAPAVIQAINVALDKIVQNLPF